MRFYYRSGKTAVDEAKLFIDKVTSKKMLHIMQTDIKTEKELEHIDERFDVSVLSETFTKII